FLSRTRYLLKYRVESGNYVLHFVQQNVQRSGEQRASSCSQAIPANGLRLVCAPAASRSTTAIGSSTAISARVSRRTGRSRSAAGAPLSAARYRSGPTLASQSPLGFVANNTLSAGCRRVLGCFLSGPCDKPDRPVAKRTRISKNQNASRRDFLVARPFL